MLRQRGSWGVRLGLRRSRGMRLGLWRSRGVRLGLRGSRGVRLSLRRSGGDGEGLVGGLALKLRQRGRCRMALLVVVAMKQWLHRHAGLVACR